MSLPSETTLEDQAKFQADWDAQMKYRKTIEYANESTQYTYSIHPEYTENKKRNPFKVALKIYALVPDEMEWKVDMKRDLDEIGYKYGHFAPELWFEIWGAFDGVINKYYDARFGDNLPEWAQKGVDRLMAVNEDPDDYS
jgi:hypothetical protein